jgi:flagellar FliL protein
VEPYLPRILDAFQVYLREMRTSDLQGSAGVYRLKEDLQRRINAAIYPATVTNVLFKEILIQ